jgi:hypothetical protein
MSAKFLEGFGSKLAEQWIANLLTPAFIFWGGGVLAFIDRHGWQAIATWFPDAKLEPLQVGILAIVLIVILVSAVVVQRFDTEVLRGLEGYWYPGLRHVGRPILKHLTQHQIQRRANLWKHWKKLSPNYTQLSAENRAEYVRIERLLRQFPGREDDFLPTRLGNILRAAERRPYDRYGLDAIICWPRLWLLLPEGAKKELIEARSNLNNGVRLFTWSCLFLVWTLWSGWAIPAAIISASFAYSWILDSAIVYGDLLESVFDLYRIALYQALRFPLPSNSAEEKAMGEQVTQYLWRGSLSEPIAFASQTEPES